MRLGAAQRIIFAQNDLLAEGFDMQDERRVDLVAKFGDRLEREMERRLVRNQQTPLKVGPETA
ncbi:hypothetical protein [Sphingopyxis panaciterrae]